MSSGGGMVRAEVLREAERLIVGDRAEDYGDARVNHNRIAALWRAYLEVGKQITAADVAVMLILLKVARTQHRHKWDNFVDIAGYAALAAEMARCDSDNCPNDDTPEDQVLRDYYSSEDYANVSKGGPYSL